MQKNKKSTQPLKVSLHGMNDRMLMMMTRFIELNCKGVADVVDEDESNVEIVDVDAAESKSLLEQRLALQPPKPIIALSLQEIPVKQGVTFVKKPVDSNNVVNALKVVKRELQKNKVSLQKISLAKAKAELENKLEKAPEKKEIKKTKNGSSYSSELARLQKERIRQKESAIKALNSPDPGASPEKLANAEIKDAEKVGETASVAEKNGVYSETEERGKLENRVAPKQEVRDIKDRGNSGVISDTPTLEKSKETLEAKEDQKLNKSKLPRHKIAKSVEPASKAKSAEQKDEVEAPSVHNEEMDRLLKELSSVASKPSVPELKNEEPKQKDSRKFIRYAFHPLEVQLKKNTFTTITVLLINTSSRGALIELRKPAKLRGKVKLIIKYDTEHVFEISARVVRREGKDLYGLQFLEQQHELTDYLVNSGRSFYFA
jgi:hypothetical protein